MSLISTRGFTMSYDMVFERSQSVKTLGVVATVVNDMIELAERTLL